MSLNAIRNETPRQNTNFEIDAAAKNGVRHWNNVVVLIQ